MNNKFSSEGFQGGPMGGGGPIGGGRIGGGGPIGGGPRPLGHGRPFGGMDHHYYHHPKPRYPYNYYPYYYNYYPYNYYYYPYNYYYPVVSYNDQDICFCTDPKDDPNEQKVCVDGTCGVCIPRSFCTTCDDKITCKKQE